MKNDRLQFLTGRYLDGVLDEAELVELEELLLSSQSAREQFWEGTAMHGLIHEAFAPERHQASDKVVPVQRNQGRPHRWQTLALVAAAVAISLFALFYFTPQENPKIAEIRHLSANRGEAVATLILAENLEWEDPALPLMEGLPLPAGDLRLKNGDAVIRFTGGAEVVLSGKTHLELLTPGRGRLHYGEAIVRAENGANGFTILTPGRELIDMGTEFAVKVTDSGNTELHVLEGRVVTREPGEIFQAGEAVQFATSEAGAEITAYQSLGFAEAVRRAKPVPRPDLVKVYEPFDYPPGKVNLADTKGGLGWAGPWRQRKASERLLSLGPDSNSDEFHIVEGKLNVRWPIRGGQSTMLALPPRDAYFVRPLAEPISMAEDSVTYLSMMLKVPPPRSKPGGDALRLTLRSSKNYFGESLSIGHGPKCQPAMEFGDGIGVKGLGEQASGQTSLWVAKIISRKDGRDEVFFRIYGEYEKLDFAEPAVWHVSKHDLHHSASFDRILISSTGETARTIDELRIGPTWRSVAPFEPDFQK